MFTICCGTLSAHEVIYDVKKERCLYHCSSRNQSGIDSPCRFVIFGKVFTVESGFGLRRSLRQAARLDDVSESTFRQLRNKKIEAEPEIASLKLTLYQRWCFSVLNPDSSLNTKTWSLRSWTQCGMSCHPEIGFRTASFHGPTSPRLSAQ